MRSSSDGDYPCWAPTCWWRRSSAIHNQVRGLQPWPGAYTTFRSQTLHIWNARVAAKASLKPWAVACGEGALELIEVQLEGRKRMSAADFANGQRLTAED